MPDSLQPRSGSVAARADSHALDRPATTLSGAGNTSRMAFFNGGKTAPGLQRPSVITDRTSLLAPARSDGGWHRPLTSGSLEGGLDALASSRARTGLIGQLERSPLRQELAAFPSAARPRLLARLEHFVREETHLRGPNAKRHDILREAFRQFTDAFESYRPFLAAVDGAMESELARLKAQVRALSAQLEKATAVGAQAQPLPADELADSSPSGRAAAHAKMAVQCHDAFLKLEPQAQRELLHRLAAVVGGAPAAAALAIARGQEGSCGCMSMGEAAASAAPFANVGSVALAAQRALAAGYGGPASAHGSDGEGGMGHLAAQPGAVGGAGVADGRIGRGSFAGQRGLVSAPAAAATLDNLVALGGAEWGYSHTSASGGPTMAALSALAARGAARTAGATLSAAGCGTAADGVGLLGVPSARSARASCTAGSDAGACSRRPSVSAASSKLGGSLAAPANGRASMRQSLRIARPPVGRLWRRLQGMSVHALKLALAAAQLESMPLVELLEGLRKRPVHEVEVMLR